MGDEYMALDPQAKIYLEMMKGTPPLHCLEPRTVREMLAVMPDGQVKEEKEINVREGRIKLRIYRPDSSGPSPVFVYFHGGGWTVGDLEWSDYTCRLLCRKLQMTIVSADYRLSPEFKFPIPAEDCYAALEWTAANMDFLNGEPGRIIIGGDSSGGNLAAEAAVWARDRGGPSIYAQVLIYPVTDFNFERESYRKYSEGFAVTRELMEWCARHYANSPADLRNPSACPMLIGDLRGLPPAIILTAENDVLKDEGLAYAKRLVEAGNQVEYKCEEGLIHGFFTSPIFAARIDGTIKRISQFLSGVKQDFTLIE